MSADNKTWDAAVASLKNRSPHPYSSVALSPNRSHAIVAGKDTLRVLSVGPKGLAETRSIRISQHFQTPVASSSGGSTSRSQSQSGGRSFGDVRDTFGLGGKQHPRSPQNITGSDAVNVIVTDVAWSLPQNNSTSPHQSDRDSFRDNEHPRLHHSDNPSPNHSLVAAAGSNGVVVIWNAKTFLNGDKNQNPLPEFVLSQHSRPVNRLAWHPGKKPFLLLTASQDSTVKLWKRSSSSSKDDASGGNDGRKGNEGMRSWFGMHAPFHQGVADRSISWECLKTFKPKSDAVRDIKWSPFNDHIFAMVTDSGYLIVYNTHVSARPWVKVAAHSGEATTVDWHPTLPYIVATGGSDRTVKIWDLEHSMTMDVRSDKNLALNANSDKSGPSQADSENSNDDTVRAGALTRNSSSHESADHLISFASASFGHSSGDRSLSSSVHSVNSSSRSKKAGAASMLHVLSVSAAVTRVIWRPPQQVVYDKHSEGNFSADRHHAMLAVASAPISGASAGGNGLLSLWTYHRPFMPLSVLEGHKEGAVTDFVWLDTPYDSSMPVPPPSSSEKTPLHADPDNWMRKSLRQESFGGEVPRHLQHGSIVSKHQVNKKKIDMAVTIGVWQHVLSVGRDGRCLLQSLARGDRPISRVPPSCFAMANLSPFQSGYGSLQIFSVHQSVPSGPKNDALLTGLRRDSMTEQSPGVFKEKPRNGEKEVGENSSIDQPLVEGMRHPARKPRLVFNVIDQGELDEETAVPLSELQKSIVVAPEVVHLSRFADSYKFYPDEECPTRVELCVHNASVAELLRCSSLFRMWSMLASVLKGSGLNELPYRCAPVSNPMGFVILPTLKSLLEQRADAGDVQTCVAICELMQVIERPRNGQEEDTGTRVPGLELNLVREWYLSYIDLLQQMCLFSHASNLMRLCNDPFIGNLNKQSTTIHESCPHCGKPILANGTNVSARRACKSCRRRVGLCFLCHEPVNGVFVWCPGCGHGGHLDHALQWFGGLSGGAVRQECPTGCGHKCNFVKKISAFPRTASMMRVSPSFDSSLCQEIQ